MAKVFEKKPFISDVLKWEVDFKFTRDKLAITATSADVDVTCGDTYTDDGTKVTDATFDCIVIENRVIPAGETHEILVLRRGPAIVDPANMSTSLGASALETRLAELNILTVAQAKVFYQET